MYQENVRYLLRCQHFNRRLGCGVLFHSLPICICVFARVSAGAHIPRLAQRSGDNRKCWSLSLPPCLRQSAFLLLFSRACARLAGSPASIRNKKAVEETVWKRREPRARGRPGSGEDNSCEQRDVTERHISRRTS